MWINEKNILLHAIGGGGDIVSTAVLAKNMEAYGCRVVVSSIVWERYSVDPEPGPIPLDNIVGCRDISKYACIATGESYALRKGRKIYFQASNVARALGREVVVIDIYEGVTGYIRGVESVLNYYGLDAIIGVDVGGDSLAYGLEDFLWSPLADAMGVAVLNNIRNSYLIVHSLGSDGELPLDYLYQRLSLIIRQGGLIGITGLSSRNQSILEEILNYAHSEASRISLMALKGFTGRVKIRFNTRIVDVTPYSLVSFILDPRVVYRESLMARLVDRSKSIFEANDRLNSVGIYTELDLENDLRKHDVEPSELNEEIYRSIRESGRLRLKLKSSV